MSNNLTSWRELIEQAMKKRGESLETTDYDLAIGTRRVVVDGEIREEQGTLDDKFYDGYGGPEGAPFTLWTRDYVYFPVVYDGAEWVESVPRNVCEEATAHVGGF